MNNHVETEASEAEVIIAGISAEPLAVTLVHVGGDTRGLRRHFVQQVPVRDSALARRVLSELNKGDRAVVTVINEWREDGCDTYLADFRRMPDVEQETAVKNGALNIVQNEITHFVIPPVRDPKAKVKQ